MNIHVQMVLIMNRLNYLEQKLRRLENFLLADFRRDLLSPAEGFASVVPQGHDPVAGSEVSRRKSSKI